MEDTCIRSLAKEIAAREYVDTHEPKHQLGPDYVIPSNDYCTWSRDGATKIINVDSSDELQKPESVISFFKGKVSKYQNYPALSVKREGVVVTWTYLEYLNAVRIVARGFIKLGLQPLHGLCILGNNSPEWLFSYLGAIFAGGFPAGIYTTNSPEACFHVLNDSLANVVLVENESQLQKILQVRDRLPRLKTIIQIIGKPSHPDVLSWNDLTYIGNSVPDTVLERRIKGIAVNQCCSLVYTSGTTGNSKGVMLSHDNVLQMAKLLNRDRFRFKECSERIVSYLPFSHMAGMTCDVYLPINAGANVFFAPPGAIRGKMVDALLDVLPTSFIGVPRPLEKIYEKLLVTEAKMNVVAKNLLSWAQGESSKYYSCRTNDLSKEPPHLFTLAKKLVLRKVKSAIGFQETPFAYSAGAPLPTKVQNYFTSIDLPIIEAYGLSETSGLHVVSTIQEYRVGSVGKPDERQLLEVKLLSTDENGTGEVLLRGRNVFMGYLHLKNQTLETLDNDRWLHTGDLGKFDSDGYLYINGRIKELVITSGGENVPPVVIESIVKKLIPAVSNCILIGDKRNYLTMLITIQTELNSKTSQPTDQLSEAAIEWCRSVGSNVSCVSEILRTKDEVLMIAIQNSITEYNEKHAISHAQRIQKWRILPQDFSIPSGELGPLAKLRRPFIIEKYSDVIDDMYNSQKK